MPIKRAFEDEVVKTFDRDKVKSNLFKMTKGGETADVHPDNVARWKDAGWRETK